MMPDQIDPPTSDHHSGGVIFSPWPTEVESDELWLGRLNFDVGSPLVALIKDNTSYSLPSADPNHDHRLEADFVSIEKKAVIRFVFCEVIAFRVLDERGLVELWSASSANPRPANTTFRASGHMWSDESVLVFMEGSGLRQSYFVATEMLCLEVVCRGEPIVTNVGPALLTDAGLEDWHQP